MTAGYLVATAGPRSLKIADKDTKDRVGRWIYDRLTNIPVELLFSGLAEGFDEAVVKFAFKLEIPVVAVIASASYGQYYYQENSITRLDRLQDFQDMLENCVEVYPVHYHHLFGKESYDRADTLVSFTDTLLAYPDETSNIITYTIDQGKQHNKNIEIYPQRNLGGAVTMQEIGLG